MIIRHPLQSPLLTPGSGGGHKIEGIGVGFEPSFLNREKFCEIRAIDQTAAFKMCCRLASKAGIFCSPSTRLNVVAAMDLAKELDPSQQIVTLSCDNSMKYLAGDTYS